MSYNKVNYFSHLGDSNVHCSFNENYTDGFDQAIIIYMRIVARRKGHNREFFINTILSLNYHLNINHFSRACSILLNLIECNKILE